MHPDEESLLKGTEDQEEAEASSCPPGDETPPVMAHHQPRSHLLWAMLPGMLNSLVLLGNIFFFLFVVNKILTMKGYCPRVPYSPASASLSWVSTPVDYDAPNPFAGELGSPELNRAWEELKIHEIFRASEEDLRSVNALNPNSLRMEHGGYMAILRVYHEIHCLDWIKREWKVEKPEMMDHLVGGVSDHCLIALRDGAMCRADLSVGSLYWWPEEEHRRIRRPPAQRRCVNWDSLQTWLRPKRLQFYGGVAEAPIKPDGSKVDVVLGDHLHTLEDLSAIP
ncbi:uncharacterized protein BO95DRAFT_435951 [Aspergillus brunneoviolaceus CBS 621.78]|uniref:Uncharacterized protein n=1 Tax=Aspergillus brunneoviolaceus CBS 621.78 TaxID=1450534 RepID=A0ACD1FWE2_9EURO|nr:hypothetical protein BO95DRAFT_435951 [Aspergillus brunneoviolaceus CBS 621.78]RAH41268.1 hypothetical protein BO95DRAFT_435951 [Aspergillus brunneoviolaceus CBS 621.78]